MRACSNASSFSAAIFFLGLVPSLFLLFVRVLLSARLLMLTFSSKGKAYLKRVGDKARVKKISSLPGESPPHSPSTLCLGSDLLSISHASSLSSALPLSASLSPSHSSPPVSLSFRLLLALLVQGTTNASQVRWQPLSLPLRTARTVAALRGNGHFQPGCPSGQGLLLSLPLLGRPWSPPPPPPPHPTPGPSTQEGLHSRHQAPLSAGIHGSRPLCSQGNLWCTTKTVIR